MLRARNQVRKESDDGAERDSRSVTCVSDVTMTSIRCRTVDDFRAEMEQHKSVLQASRLSKKDLLQIIRLKADKICISDVCARVGCSEEEVLAAQWVPQGRNAFRLFCLEKGMSGPNNMSRLGKSWSAFKHTEEYKIYEQVAESEKLAEETIGEEWDCFLEGRRLEDDPLETREERKKRLREEAAKVIVKKAKRLQPADAKEHHWTKARVHNDMMLSFAEEFKSRRARWFDKHWESVSPFLPQESRSRESSLAQRLIGKVPPPRTDANEEQVQMQPATVVGGEMFDYQLDGLKWLLRMNDHGVGMILGDEMGLGKTIQTISLLAVLAERKETQGMHLIVCPLSVLGTWESEFRRWCPTLKVLVLHGAKKCRDGLMEELRKEEDGECDVLITTYEMMVAETRR
eukprot:763266-Hanusia_phi.AAC.1